MMNEENSYLLPVGTILQGRYRVERQLSSGGFGNTYLVTNVRFDERWAIKEFFMKTLNNRDEDSVSVNVTKASEARGTFEAQRAKFNKEAQRLRKLRHRGIVHVEDLFDENGTSYYVMNYVDGGSLSTMLKQNGPFSEESVRQMLPELLDALEYVHNQHIWHLDLKPANILLEREGDRDPELKDAMSSGLVDGLGKSGDLHPVLIDFGASKQMKQGQFSTSVMTYTPGYAPSEQVDQNYDRIGPWTDLYALGATIYNLLTGDTPPTVSEITELEDEAFKFPKQVSKEMEKLVLWMMTPNRRRRPQSVQEVRDFLKKRKEEPKVRPKETDDRETHMPESRRTDSAQPIVSPESTVTVVKQGPSTAVILMIAVLVVGLIAGLWMWQKSTSPTDNGITYSNIAAGATYTNSIGTYIYNGPVDDERKPDGMGSAIFTDGRSYQGMFEHGVMQGPATFRFNNGDVFEGQFRDDHFHVGKFTRKSDGMYYRGPFSNGQPTDKGEWFDKDGKKINL